MLAFEPLVEVRSPLHFGRVRMHYSAGVTYDFLAGRDFRRFDKAGFKFRPVRLMFGTWQVDVNVRIYPRGFTDDEFGKGPRIADRDRPSETVVGINVGMPVLWR